MFLKVELKFQFSPSFQFSWRPVLGFTHSQGGVTQFIHLFYSFNPYPYYTTSPHPYIHYLTLHPNSNIHQHNTDTHTHKPNSQFNLGIIQPFKGHKNKIKKSFDLSLLFLLIVLSVSPFLKIKNHSTDSQSRVASLLPPALPYT